MTRDLASALTEAARSLSATSDTPRLDAELLAAHLLNVERSDMLLKLRDLDAPDGFDALIERRVAGEPVAHITGRAEFWSLPLIVTRDVLIPRPDSETLIEQAEAHFRGRPPPRRILDLGTGSGALLAAALTVFARAAGTGIDASVAAANVASKNMVALGLAGRAEIRELDWTQPAWADQLDRPFDLVLCNPPYIDRADGDLADAVRRYEPGEALFAGDNGLEHYRLLIPQLHDLLSKDGIALFEIGHRQAEAVCAIAHSNGWRAASFNDLAGLSRVVKIANE